VSAEANETLFGPEDLVAIRLDVDALGGFKEAGAIAFPDDVDPTNAQKKLSNFVGSNGRQLLAFWRIKRLGVATLKKTGRSAIYDYFFADVPLLDVKIIPREVFIERGTVELDSAIKRVEQIASAMREWGKAQ
jgi:hypothetical protein